MTIKDDIKLQKSMIQERKKERYLLSVRNATSKVMTFEEQIVTHDEINLSQIVEPAGGNAMLDNSSLIINQGLIKRLSERKHNNSTIDVAEVSKRELTSSSDSGSGKMIAIERDDIFTNFE